MADDWQLRLVEPALGCYFVLVSSLILPASLGGKLVPSRQFTRRKPRPQKLREHPVAQLGALTSIQVLNCSGLHGRSGGSVIAATPS